MAISHHHIDIIELISLSAICECRAHAHAHHHRKHQTHSEQRFNPLMARPVLIHLTFVIISAHISGNVYYYFM